MLTADKIPTYDAFSTPSLSILLVDDSTVERTLLSLRLNKQGHTSTEVDSGQKSLEYLNNPAANIDLILLDVLITCHLRVLRVTASFGITDLQALTDSRPSFLARADQVCYLAKRAGRNCVMTL